MNVFNKRKSPWIPVGERLPSDKELMENLEFIVMIKGADFPTTLCFVNGFWMDWNSVPYDVLAWALLPKPYRPEVR